MKNYSTPQSVMSKNILTLILVALLNIILLSAPLRFVPQTITQPDGTVIHCFASGDEFHNWLHDENGFTIIQDSKTGIYFYAQKDNDQLISSPYVVGKTDLSQTPLVPWINISEQEYEKRREKFFKINNRISSQLIKSRGMEFSSSAPSAPREGTMNNLVIFIRFNNDAEFSNQTSYYNNMFNGNTKNDVSLLSYFREASYNKLTISSSFYPAASGNNTISYKDSHPRNYYQVYNAASNPAGYDPDITDYQNENGKIFREHTLLNNAIKTVASQIPSGLNIDADNDGIVDNICFVIKGTPDGWNDLLWPHKWTLWSQQVILKEKLVYQYNFQLDSDLKAGVLCHENFHVLGAPDLYHYSYDNMTPVGPWDLMEIDYDIPQHMCSFMKYRYGGWINEIPEIKQSGTYTLNPLISSENNCFKIQSPNSFTEYFVVDYRKKQGIFENSIPGEGLVVYRINLEADNIGNRTGPPDEVYVYRPGGTLTTNGDIFNAFYCQSANRTAINDQGDPQSFLQNGSAGGLDISNVGTSANSTISFDVNLNFTPREYIHYDCGYYGAFGKNDALDFQAAVKFTSAELADCYGSKLSHIMLYINESGQNDITVKVWKGSTSAGPEQLVYEKNISSDIKLNNWTVHALINPLILENGKDYWIGYQIKATGGFPMGFSRNKLIKGKGGWINIGDGWKQLSDFSLEGNWNIRGIIEKQGSSTAEVSASQLDIKVQPGETGAANFTIKNTGTANINYSISASGGNILKPAEHKNLILSKKIESSDRINSVKNFASKADYNKTKIAKIGSEDVLYLDDGNETPNKFIGYEGFIGFCWVNKFDLTDFGFDLKKIQVFLRSENSMLNFIGYSVYNADLQYVCYNTLFLDNSENGQWYEIELENTQKFDKGESFYIEIDSYNNALYPAGFDNYATIKDNSYYITRENLDMVNMNTIPAYKDGAFLIRAVGAKNEGVLNQPPIAIGSISKTEAVVGEQLAFDASQSYDPDGQISEYNWNFGDGNNSNQMMANHTYTVPGNYNISLIVTDNQGATDKAEGQIQISEGTPNKNPHAIAVVSKNEAAIGEVIEFDGSQSSDEDGNIVGYLWEFGDGNSTFGANVNHSYSIAGVYQYKLKVTDDKNGTGETEGQISVSETASRFTINPSNGILSPSESISISVSYNSTGLPEGTYLGQLSIITGGGNFIIPINILISHFVSADEEQIHIPTFKLSQNFPNPFNNTTEIQFELPAELFTEITVFDIMGKEIKTLIKSSLRQGVYSIPFDASGVSSGVYFYRIKAGKFSETKKFILLK